MSLSHPIAPFIHIVYLISYHFVLIYAREFYQCLLNIVGASRLIRQSAGVEGLSKRDWGGEKRERLINRGFELVREGLD